jgi:GNAT superfamily N-acetyltransferase
MSEITLVDLSDPADPALDGFYALYARIFTLVEEREPIEGFRKVLALNSDPLAQKHFGPFVEEIVLAVESGTNRILGAMNHVFYRYLNDQAGSFGASCQLNFICVDQRHRSRGIASLLLKNLSERLSSYSGAVRPSAFITCEQNNPARMTAEQVSQDTSASGTDPYERMKWWVKRGYRKLDFPYRQPPLSPEQESCEYLDYFVHFVSPDEYREPLSLPAPVLREHLRRFFFVSVGKLSGDMASNREWLDQCAFLSARDQIDIVPAPP